MKTPDRLCQLVAFRYPLRQTGRRVDVPRPFVSVLFHVVCGLEIRWREAEKKYCVSKIGFFEKIPCV